MPWEVDRGAVARYNAIERSVKYESGGRGRRRRSGDLQLQQHEAATQTRSSASESTGVDVSARLLWSYIIHGCPSATSAFRPRPVHVLGHSYSSMSLSSTTTVKSQITNALGPKAPLYFAVLKEYLSGRISRNEYDEQVKTHLDSTHLREWCTGRAKYIPNNLP